MSSLNEKGRKRVAMKLKTLNTGFIYNYMGYSRDNMNDKIASKIIETCCNYTDPVLVWIAIQVFIRFNPTTNQLDNNNDDNNSNLNISTNCKSLIIKHDSENKEELQFDFDHIFNAESTIKNIFETTGKQLIDALLIGYNSSLVSYGHNDCGTHSIIFGKYKYDPFDNYDNYLIGDDGIYQQCMKYLFSELESKKSMNTESNGLILMNWDLELQHIFTYPVMQLIDDALVNKDDDDEYLNENQIKIRSRKAFDDRSDNKIFIENARSVRINKYDEIKKWWQIGHDNIYSAQLKYAKIEQDEAKSNYYEYRNSINQIISIDLNQYFNDGTLIESNLKFIIPIYYDGEIETYQNVLSNSLPLSNYNKSAQLTYDAISRTKSDNTMYSEKEGVIQSHDYVEKKEKKKKTNWKKKILNEKDPLYTVCSALSKDLMPRYKNCYFTHLLKDVLGGNCKTMFLLNCSLNIDNKLELIKCLQFGKLLNLIYCNPKINGQSIREWSAMYNALRYKYDKLYDEINEEKKKYELIQSKSVTNITNDTKHNINHYKTTKKKEQEYRNDHKVIKQGYLHKEGGVIKSIKIRYFVLFEKGRLAYYDDITSKKEIGIIDVKHDFKNIQIINWLDDDNQNFHGFILSTKQRAWKLGTGSINEVNKWVKVLKRAGGRYY